ncbi:putative quinol monooxygenase [Bacillus dakarensis]|uniref:putative quinol monooxygenase n=1 Tax=Robertmurraya dakarensis TaxID=1926278 RepID=UPI0009810F91|nr:putative quinol monooxygenase [Bacillus dakarensis]
MASINITAVIKAKEGLGNQLKEELKKVQVLSQQEEGNIKYDLFQSNENTFIFQEEWATKEALKNHAQAPHFLEYRDRSADLVLDRDVYMLRKVE